MNCINIYFIVHNKYYLIYIIIDYIINDLLSNNTLYSIIKITITSVLKCIYILLPQYV